MIGISSRSAGVLLLPKTVTGEYTVLDVVGGEEQDPFESKYLYSAVQDWEEIGGPDTDSLLKTASREYWLAQTVSLLRLAIVGLEESLEKEVLEHVEELLSSRVSSETVLDRLLVAPLAVPSSCVALAKSALSGGFSAVADILNELADLQTLLTRLTNLWLSIDEATFSHFSEPREMIWVTLVEKCGMKQLLNAGSGREFMSKWNLLVYNFPTPQSRAGVGILGKELSRRLFPSYVQEEIVTSAAPGEVDVACLDTDERVVKDHETFERVTKQIDGISQAVSQGQDAKAEKFLRELIQDQTSPLGGESYAVKSLCKIAQRCADMFRIDFEVFCLDKALQLDPLDAWALIQYGDHLKRVGNYDGALRTFEKAEQLGESVVAKSSAADVYSQQGDYETAIHKYKIIPNWSHDPKVLTAIADNLRKMGRMEDAQEAYRELIDFTEQGLPEFADNDVRAHVGIAEIAKGQGRLTYSLEIYRKILKRKDVEERDLCIYKLALCNVLKLMEKFDDAYAVVDEVIQQYPFAMQARFIRGSILGLLGRELEGLKDLPESSVSRSWREWLRRYYRGLLLFKLERYEDAQKNLVEEISKAIASEQEKAILRMASTLSFLREGQIPEADGILSKIPELYDCHAKYLSLVLKLHSATQKEDLARMNSLKERIAGLQVVDAKLDKAVVALGDKNFSLALTYETDALLKLAA